MASKKKIMVIYSIIYGLLIAIGIVLMSLAFSKVPFGYYGIRINYFSSSIDQQYYTNGLYHKEIGYYFVLYPSTKQYILEEDITVTTNDLLPLQITYTVCYRINPANLLAMYQQIALSYQSRLISIINNIISSYVNDISQSQTRTLLQQSIVSLYNNDGLKTVNKIFKGGLIIESIWINKLNYLDLESYYQQAYVYSSSSSPAYESASFNLSIAQLQLNSLKSVLSNTKANFMQSLKLQEQKVYNSQAKQGQIIHSKNIARISEMFNISRIMNYYQPFKFQFV